MKPTLIVLDNTRNTITRYIDGKPENVYTIADRAGFDKSFNENAVEWLRTKPQDPRVGAADEEQA